MAQPSTAASTPESTQSSTPASASESIQAATGEQQKDAVGKPAAPSDLEEALGGIWQDGSRQNRLVILDDPAIKEQFSKLLEEHGEVSFEGGT